MKSQKSNFKKEKLFFFNNLKDETEFATLISGRSFQIIGALTAKASSPLHQSGPWNNKELHI